VDDGSGFDGQRPQAWWFLCLLEGKKGNGPLHIVTCISDVV
jgi:hypothetical protein